MLLLNGDCIEQMQKLKDEGKQIDSVVTDPPYHLTSIVERYGKDGSAPAKDRDGLYQRQARGFMGKEWDGGDIAFRTDTWKLAYDLLKPGGYLLAFSASRNYHRMAVAIEDAGFEIRDQIMWIYGSGFPKSLNIGKAIDKRNGVQGDVIGTRKVTSSDIGQKSGWNHLNTDRGDYEYREIMNEYEGWGTALKPAHEPIVMARKPLEGTNIDNVLKYGTGGINIDGCRIQGDDTGGERKITTRKSRDENNVWTDENSGMKQEENHFADADPKGRYPANVIHDGSDVVQEIFPKTSKSTGGKTKSAFGDIYGTYSGDVLSSSAGGFRDEGSASRYFYCPKTSAEERNRGLESFTAKPMAWGNQAKAELKRGNLDFKGNQGDGSKHNKVAMRLNTHPTVKPQELMKYLCRLVTPKGGVVLDPFMGSGSTGMAAKDEGFDFIGIEKEKEYFEIAEARIIVSSPLMEFM